MRLKNLPSRQRHRWLIAGALCAVVLAINSSSRGAELSDSLVMEKVDWAAFLGKHDLVWNALPKKWTQSPFIGNGLLGIMVYSDRENPLRWDLGSTNVWDHRAAPPGRQLNPAFDRARLPLGHFTLRPAGTVVATEMRLGLWDAEMTGKLTTDKGSISFRAFTHATEPVIVIEFSTTGGENGFTWEWQPAESVSPRADPAMHRSAPAGYQANPPAKMDRVGADPACLQAMTAGGEYATVWRETRPDETHRRIFITVGYSPVDTSDRVQAGSVLDRTAKEGIAKLIESHRAWWHRYYPESFVSFPDTQLEGFYWIQMYKLASATRADQPALDLYGPWFPPTPWPYLCWNMNEQVEYSPVYAANRLELGESLCRMLETHVAELKENVPPKYRPDCAALGRATSIDCAGQVSNEIGDLPWALHNYWRQCAWAGDDARARDKLFPLLKLSINYYLRLLHLGADGKLHLPPSFSPEYGGAQPDANYDLSLLRWGLLTLIETATKFSLPDADLPKWRDTLAQLVDYPQDAKDGLMIGAGVPLAHAHRHYSHLLMIFPLRTMNWDQPGSRDLIEKSLAHWLNVPGPDKLGFTYLGAASINATLGRGDVALDELHQILAKMIYPNTMYSESCIETPLGMAESVHDMLLHSLNSSPGSGQPSVIHVFPAIPTTWKDVSFHHLRAEGAFLLSGVRANGVNRWVSIKSLEGKPCVIAPGLREGFTVSSRAGRKIAPEKLKDGVYSIPLEKGEEVILSAGRSEFTVLPVASNPKQENFYGLH